MPTVRAVTLPDHLDPIKLRGRIAIVIDVLRATTTIAHALGRGASCLVPVASVDAARMIAHDRPGSLLCGERDGIKPDGFALGNSPEEYTRETVGGQELVLSTTNGTRALHLCSEAHEVLAGSITNLDAVTAEAAGRDLDIALVCSGTDRLISLEDCICAGLMVEVLQETHTPDDSALLMRDASFAAIQRCGGLGQAIASSFHAHRLTGLGFGHDVRFASERSSCTIVPRFDPATGEIHGIEQHRITHA